jgi:hypothetical protein
LAIALVFSAASATALDLLGKVVVPGERASDAPEPVADASVSVAGSAVTTASGTFKLGLPFAAGATVTLEVAHDGHVIYRPHGGQLQLPRPPADGAPPKPVQIQLLPQGDHRLLDDDSIRRAFEHIAREAQDPLRPDGSPDEIDFTRYLEELGHRLGFPLPGIERAVADWQDRKRDNPNAELHERGLVALSEKRFDDARRLFRHSRLANDEALTDAERRMAELQAEIDAQRRLLIRELRAEAEAASLAHDFAAALKLYQDALGRIDRAAKPEEWARAQADVAGARLALGIRLSDAAAERQLAAAIDAYRAALSVDTRETLPQQWGKTQNDLAIALAEQGIRASGEDRARLLTEAVDAFRAALTVRAPEALPYQWTQTQMNLLHALAELQDAAGMAAVLEDLLRADPHNADLYNDAQTLYHEVVFDFDAAHRVNRTWLEHNPDDLTARCNLAESLLTTGRVAEARDALATLIAANAPTAYAPAKAPPLPLDIEGALRLLEIAALTRLAADGDANASADASAEAAEELAERRDQLAELLAARPDDAPIGWSFGGALHYLATDPAFAPHRERLLPLFQAAAQGRDALLVLLR